MDVLAEILEWSTKQPAWQRDALRRLFTGGSLAPADVEVLLDLCKAQHGLSAWPGAEPLSKEHLAIREAGATPVSLVSVTHHAGVNALAAEQTLAFGPNLTIVYGHNAAGKSGYTRILKQACRSRSPEEVLGNVLSEGAPLRARATVRFRVGNDERSAEWTAEAAPTGALAAVSVFDGQCAPVYIRDKTDVAFRPFGLDVFDKLSSACGELRKRLEGEQALLRNAAAILPRVPDGTRVAALFSNLTSLTKPDDVRTLATLQEREGSRLTELREKQRDLQASDPGKRARELELRAGRVDQVAGHIAGLVDLLGDTGLQAISVASETLAAARTALEHLRRTVLTPDLLPRTGEEAWRTMWDAAREFSSIAYPGVPFPVVSKGARCPLCQQAVGAEAASHFQHFTELVTSTAHAEVREAEADYASKLATVSRAAITREDVSLALDEIATDDPTLANGIRDFLKKAAEVKEAVTSAPASGKRFPAKGVHDGLAASLRRTATAFRERAAGLRGQVKTMSPTEAAELKELEARVTLQEQLDLVLGEIERKKQLAAYTPCIEDTNTNPLTRKSTDLTKRLVTDRLREQFQGELGKLEFTDLSVEIRAAGGTRGALFHQLVFSNAPGVAVAKVLSEGEARTLSLAAFLAELSTASTRSAIIFDDPVSSLDHIWRERIARRLVLEAKSRQVIVFSHDLLFLRYLLDEREKQEVPHQNQWVRRGVDAAGICSSDVPWVAMRVKECLGVLRARWQNAEKLFRTDGPDAYERDAREVYALLREAWEKAVEEVLLNDVVERFRRSIETKRVRQLHDITKDDCDALERGMTDCSRWIRGHAEAAAEGTPFPKPADLLKSIQVLEDWIQRIRKRREGKKSSQPSLI
jgi:hypothetical protein